MLLVLEAKEGLSKKGSKEGGLDLTERIFNRRIMRRSRFLRKGGGILFRFCEIYIL